MPVHLSCKRGIIQGSKFEQMGDTLDYSYILMIMKMKMLNN